MQKLLYAHAEHTRKRFYRMLSILGTDFIAHWAYEERISAHAQPAIKCELFYMYNLCWAYQEQILSHTEHTQNEFHRMLSILGTDFIACWACADMFKRRISLPIRIRFLKISSYRPLGPYGFGFCKKVEKKISCLCTFKPGRVWFVTSRLGMGKSLTFFYSVYPRPCADTLFTCEIHGKNAILQGHDNDNKTIKLELLFRRLLTEFTFLSSIDIFQQTFEVNSHVISILFFHITVFFGLKNHRKLNFYYLTPTVYHSAWQKLRNINVPCPVLTYLCLA
jgi:hypothetical protein